MNPISHLLTGWVVANTADLTARDRALVTLAGVVPDIDGLGVIAEILTEHTAKELSGLLLDASVDIVFFVPG